MSRDEPGNRFWAAATIAIALAFIGSIVLLVAPPTSEDERAKPTATAPSAPGLARIRPVQTALLGEPASSGIPHGLPLVDAAPTVYDLDGDGRRESVVHANDTRIYVLAHDGRALARLETRHPEGWFVERVLNEVAVSALGPDEPPSLVVANHAAVVTAFRFVPAESDAERFVFETSWERRVNDCGPHASMDAGAMLADVDDDGRLEIFVQTEEVGLFALNADGQIRWHHCWGGGNSAPVVDDLDGDGRLEAIFASDAGLLAVFDAATGEVRWTLDAKDAVPGLSPASIVASPTVAELDGKAPKEVLFTARHAPAEEPARYGSFHMAIVAAHADPQTGAVRVLWARQPEWAHPMSHTRLVVADVDGDGRADVFGMDWNTIGHKPGNWEALGPAHAFRLDAEGRDVWVREADSWWSNHEVALVGSGKETSLLASGAHEGDDGLVRLSASTGKPLGFVSLAPWKLMRGPVVLETSARGGAVLALAIAPDAPLDERGAVMILELPSFDRGG